MKRITFVLILCILLSACASVTPSTATPDADNLSSILDSFKIEGFVYDTETKKSYIPEGHDLIIQIPDGLILEGFHMRIFGQLPEGGQEVLYTEADAVPGGQLVISPENRSKYTVMHMSLDYSQDGSYLCYQNCNLFTGTSSGFIPYRPEP